MDWNTWAFFLATATLAGLMPGPAVLYVISQGMRHGGRKSAWAAAGVLSANAVYFALSATSLAALILASYDLFLTIKWLGAAYLIYMGLRCLLGRESGLNLQPGEASEPTTASGPATISGEARRIWLNGALLQGANPKALLFFGSILPQFVDTSRPVGAQVFIMGVTSIGVEFWILFGYGCLAARAVAAINHQRYATAINRVAGALLIAAGLGMARLSRS